MKKYIIKIFISIFILRLIIDQDTKLECVPYLTTRQ